ncbi:APC family permease [Pseudonocardia kunmingensis]|uniref:APA family basic amino acid/polyamine antiporter n=1 Tax=Pseudonocardia kunmingensis TaxID=630975 RepID=A0A543DNQ2_9PSEU|nr:APC family permease [Pseudonocardia kunmingensis]TQM10938.1 APA family basic amino acid/polyamine antiporter [Pseudonocardia kunmingensis]
MSSSLQRRLGTADATVLGLAAMLGTGVFAVWAPAAAAAGPWLLLAVVLAGVVAACNAASTADLAVAHPESGGGYVYGRARLSPGAGRLAGVAFLVGKTASAAAAAGVFGSYVLPSAPLPAAVMVIVAVTVLNTAGVRWTSRGAYALVGGTLAVLLVVVAIGLLGPEAAPVSTAATPDVEPVPTRGGVFGVLTAAGLVFFAFAGYARIATLGEEVRDPRRTLRRAIALALGIALVTYLLVAAALLAGLGSGRLATEAAPLVAVVDGGEASALGVLVRAGAAVAAGSALLSVLVGVSRTTLAMARRGELPTALATISSRGTPWRADVLGGLVAIGVAALAGPVAAIALSACSVLVYYGVINLAALRLPLEDRSWPRWTSWLGLLLCAGLAAMLPTQQVVTTAVALAVGWVLCTVLGRSATGEAGAG